jgi:hypothetical protein
MRLESVNVATDAPSPSSTDPSALLHDPRTREILDALRARAGDPTARVAPGVLSAGFVMEPWEREALRRGGGQVSQAADRYAAWLGALVALRVRAEELGGEEYVWRAGSSGLMERAADARGLLQALEGSLGALDAAKQELSAKVGHSRVKQLEQTELQVFRAALALRDRLKAASGEEAVPLAQLQSAEDRFRLPRAPVARVRAAAARVVSGAPRPLRWALALLALGAAGLGGWELVDRLSAPTARALLVEELRAMSPYLAEGWAPTRPGAPFIGKVRLDWDDLPDQRRRTEAEQVAKALDRLGTRSALVYRPHLGLAYQIAGGKVVHLR